MVDLLALEVVVLSISIVLTVRPIVPNIVVVVVLGHAKEYLITVIINRVVDVGTALILLRTRPLARILLRRDTLIG